MVIASASVSAMKIRRMPAVSDSPSIQTEVAALRSTNPASRRSSGVTKILRKNGQKHALYSPVRVLISRNMVGAEYPESRLLNASASSRAAPTNAAAKHRR